MLTQRAPLCEVLLWGSDAEDMKERMMLHVFISLLLPRSGLGSANRTALRSENKKKICCLHAFSSSHSRKRRPLGVADLAHYLLLQKALVLPLQLFLQASHRSLCWSHGIFIFREISGGMRAGALSETHLSFMMVAEALLSLLIYFFVAEKTNKQKAWPIPDAYFQVWNLRKIKDKTEIALFLYHFVLST